MEGMLANNVTLRYAGLFPVLIRTRYNRKMATTLLTGKHSPMIRHALRRLTTRRADHMTQDTWSTREGQKDTEAWVSSSWNTEGGDGEMGGGAVASQCFCWYFRPNNVKSQSHNVFWNRRRWDHRTCASAEKILENCFFFCIEAQACFGVEGHRDASVHGVQAPWKGRAIAKYTLDVEVKKCVWSRLCFCSVYFTPYCQMQ